MHARTRKVGLMAGDRGGALHSILRTTCVQHAHSETETDLISPLEHV